MSRTPKRGGRRLMLALKLSFMTMVVGLVGDFTQGPDSPLPWGMLGNAGIGLTLLFAIWMFMKFLRDERVDRSSERDKYLGAIKDMTAGFADRVEQSNTRSEVALRELAAELRQHRNVTGQPPRGSVPA